MTGPTLTDMTSRTGPGDVTDVAGSGHALEATDASEPTCASRPAHRSFPWATRPGATDDEIRTGRRRWYSGAVFALLWQALELIAVWSDGRGVADHVWASIALGVLYAAYLFAPELMWRRSLRDRVAVVTGVAVLAGLLLLVVGPLAVWTWLLVAALTGFVAERFWIAGVAVLAIVGAQFLVAATAGWDQSVNSGILFAPVITVSVGASMLFFGRQREAEDRLGLAQDELTRLAVVEERARFSRDLHDVLGHSLTVVAMKSELAARLVDVDPVRAKTEMQDVERLSREALQGLRHAVSGYRQADLDTELVSARAALDAAEIDAVLPRDGDAAAEDVRSLFAWVLREGITNVVRHAAASHVRVTLTRTALTVEDDGTGAVRATDRPGAAGGNGLRGLRERADAVGAAVTTGTSDLGGFRLRVERNRR